MLGAGAIMLAVGLLALIIGIFQKLKVGRMSDAPHVSTGDAATKGTAVANPKGMLSVEGKVSCPQPLTSPMTGTPCMYYELKVTARWKDGETQKEKQLTHDKVAAPFYIDDGSGQVRVDATGGGDYEPTNRRSDTKGAGLIGGITGQDLVFGNYRVSPGMFSNGTKYTVEEAVLPVVEKLYANGKVGSSNEITSPGFRRLIVSNKSRSDLLASTTQVMKIALIAGAGLTVVGGVLSVLGGMKVSSDDSKTAAASASASASAAPKASAAPSSAATDAPAGTGTAGPVGGRPAGTGAAGAKPAGTGTGAAGAAKPPAKGKKK